VGAEGEEPLRVLVDHSAAFHQGAGIGRYGRQVVPAAAAELPRARWTLFHAPSRPHPPRFEVETLAAFAGTGVGVRVRRAPLSRRRLDQLWFRARLPLPVQVFGGGADVVYSPDFTAPPAGGAPRVMTVHDLAFLVRPELVPEALRRYLAAVVPRQIATAARVVAVSGTTRRDLAERLGVPPDRIAVVPNGVEGRFFSAEPMGAVDRRRHGLPAAYLLCVGTIEPRKNHATLFRALSRWADGVDLPLVVVGRRGWDAGPILAEAEPLRRDGRLVFLGYVADALLPALYAGAAATVYPSWYEGFGLPVLESLAAGVPTVTSDAPALREVGGGATIVAPADDAEALGAAIGEALSVERQGEAAAAARRAVAREATWEASGRALADVLRAASGRGTG
jgi:glycosyltransferase involved in cell wall biosynthesis